MAVLVDTSVWIAHLRARSEGLAVLLEEEQVLVHPFVLGELALGDLGTHRRAILEHLRQLPVVTPSADDEVQELIARRRLMSTGIGYFDAHLVSAALRDQAYLWTLDGPLARQAARLGVGFAPR